MYSFCYSVDIITHSSPTKMRTCECTIFTSISLLAGYDDFLAVRNPAIAYDTLQRDTRACFNLSIVNDNLQELSELINVSISDSDIQILQEYRGFTIGFSHTIVMIQPDSNDSKWVYLTMYVS